MKNIKSNFIALFAHLGIATTLSYVVYLENFHQLIRNNFVTDLIVLTTIVGLLMYILIGYAQLHIQRTLLRDFLSIISPGIFGLAIATAILIEFHRVPFEKVEHLLWTLGWNFSDVMGITWEMRSLFYWTVKGQIISFSVASFIPSLLIWFGMWLKRMRLLN